MPGLADEWVAGAEPFTQEQAVWPFWRLPEVEAATGIRQMRGAGVNFLTQEYGWYAPELWRDWRRVMCIRHPIDRLYSDFLHTQEYGKLPSSMTFSQWAEAEVTDAVNRHSGVRLRQAEAAGLPGSELCADLYAQQLGRGDLNAARAPIDSFHTILILERFQDCVNQMASCGWKELDAERHFRSWTARRPRSGRQELAGQPDLLQALTAKCQGELLLYEHAYERVFGKRPKDRFAGGEKPRNTLSSLRS
jgi:hypothetical protein